MPQLGPVTIAVATDGRPSHRVSVDGSGATRIDTLAVDDGEAEVEGYTIYTGTRMGQLLTVDGRPSWYEQADAISEDPRVFVYATLGAAQKRPVPGMRGCRESGRGVRQHACPWLAPRGRRDDRRSAGPSRVLRHRRAVDRRGDPPCAAQQGRRARRGRAARAGGDPDRRGEQASRRGSRPPSCSCWSRPLAPRSSTRPPTACAQDPACGVPPEPVVTPPPAEGEPGRPEDLEALVAAAVVAPEALGAFQVELQGQYAGGRPSVTYRVLSDGAGSYRREQGLASQPESWESCSSAPTAATRWSRRRTACRTGGGSRRAATRAGMRRTR